MSSSPIGFNPLFVGEVSSSWDEVFGPEGALMFQSPLRRGSVFIRALVNAGIDSNKFQSPLRRGSVFILAKKRKYRQRVGCFNPLFVGEVSSS